MSYIIKQRDRNGNLYAYQVESYWDPTKKQSRQKRTYLGVWDEKTGTIKDKESQRSIKNTKIYGSPYLLYKLAEELGLTEKLLAAFGSSGWELVALVMGKVLKPLSLKNIHYLMEDSFIPEFCSLSHVFNSQWLSRYLEDLAGKEMEQYRFFHTWISKSDTDTLAYDITSLSSYSKMLELLEYGYNRDGCDLPQINLGLVMSLKRRIPLYYKIFPGSINDVVTLKNLIADMKEFGVGSCQFILDRGFYSESNINEMLQEHMEFVIPLPFNVKAGKVLVSGTNIDIINPINAKRYGGDIYHVVEKEINVFDSGIYGYVIYSKKRESDEIHAFYNRLMDIEMKLDKKKVYGNPDELISRVAGGMRNHFQYTVKDYRLYVKRKPKSISQAIHRFGKMILLSSSKRSWDEVLSEYRQRDMIEKEYRYLKQDLEALPLRVRKQETLKGLLFIFFLSLILRTYLMDRARQAHLLQKQSVSDLLCELSKLRAVNIGGLWRLSEVTKKQRTILETLGISIPVIPQT